MKPVVESKQYARARLRLGDKIASVAQPIAKTIDKAIGTNIRNCKSCKKRREYLNNLTK